MEVGDDNLVLTLGALSLELGERGWVLNDNNPSKETLESLKHEFQNEIQSLRLKNEILEDKLEEERYVVSELESRVRV